MYSGRIGIFLIAMILACIVGISMLLGIFISWNNTDTPDGSTPDDSTQDVVEEQPTNVVVTGNADVNIQYVGEDKKIHPFDITTKVFEENIVWTPGHAEVAYIILTNNGDNPLNYSVGANIISENGSVNTSDEEFKLSDYLEFGFVSIGSDVYENGEDAIADLSESNLLNSGVSKNATLGAGETTDRIAIVVYLPRTALEKVTVKEGEALPEITLGLTVLVTQPIGE